MNHTTFQLPLLALALALPLAGCTCGGGPRAESAANKQQAQSAISSLPYLSSRPIDESDKSLRMGVTRYQRDKASPGITVYCSEQTDEVKYLDMAGKVVHRVPLRDANCRYSVPFGREDLLIMGNGVLARVGWDGTVRWRKDQAYDPKKPGSQLSFHHDVFVGKKGAIYSLVNRNRLIKRKKSGLSLPIRDDEIVVFGPRGNLWKRVSVYDLVKGEIPAERLEDLAEWVKQRSEKEPPFWDHPTDLIHTNTVAELPAVKGFSRAGQVLIAARYLDLLAVADLKTRRLVWRWGPGELEWPHEPVLLPSGNLLIFDNGARRRRSRVLELDPRTKKVVWEYRSKEGQDTFFSESRGGAQFLPGGTILITESDSGRIFEVTRAGEVVWEFWNPDLIEEEKDGKKVSSRRLIYRARRYDATTCDQPAFGKLWRRVQRDVAAARGAGDPPPSGR